MATKGKSLFNKLSGVPNAMPMFEGEKHPPLRTKVNGKWKTSFGNYLGPGTRHDIRILRRQPDGSIGDKPVNRADRAAMGHDLRLALAENEQQARAADEKFVKVMKRLEREGEPKMNTTWRKIIQSKMKMEDRGLLRKDKYYTPYPKSRPGLREIAKRKVRELDQQGYGSLMLAGMGQKMSPAEILKEKIISSTKTRRKMARKRKKTIRSLKSGKAVRKTLMKAKKATRKRKRMMRSLKSGKAVRKTLMKAKFASQRYRVRGQGENVPKRITKRVLTGLNRQLLNRLRFRIKGRGMETAITKEFKKRRIPLLMPAYSKTQRGYGKIESVAKIAIPLAKVILPHIIRPIVQKISKKNKGGEGFFGNILGNLSAKIFKPVLGVLGRIIKQDMAKRMAKYSREEYERRQRGGKRTKLDEKLFSAVMKSIGFTPKVRRGGAIQKMRVGPSAFANMLIEHGFDPVVRESAKKIPMSRRKYTSLERKRLQNALLRRMPRTSKKGGFLGTLLSIGIPAISSIAGALIPEVVNLFKKKGRGLQLAGNGVQLAGCGKLKNIMEEIVRVLTSGYAKGGALLLAGEGIQSRIQNLARKFADQLKRVVGFVGRTGKKLLPVAKKVAPILKDVSLPVAKELLRMLKERGRA